MIEYTEIIIAVIGVATAITTYLVGSKKSKKEVDSLSIKNASDSLKLYQLIIDDLRDEIRELHKKIEKLETVIIELKSENANLKDLIHELKKDT